MPSCSSEMMSILESLCIATFIDPSWHDNQWDMTQDINKHPSWPNNQWDMTQDVNKVYRRYGTSYWEKIQARRFWWALERYVIMEVNGILARSVVFPLFWYWKLWRNFARKEKHGLLTIWPIFLLENIKTKKKKNFCIVKIFWASFIRLSLKKKREFQRNKK